MLVLKVSVLASVACVCLAVTFPQTIDRLEPVMAHSLPETLLQLMNRPVRRQGYYPIPITLAKPTRDSRQLKEPTITEKRQVKPSESSSSKRHSKQLPDKPQLEQITRASINPYLGRQGKFDTISYKKTPKSLKMMKKEKKHHVFAPANGGEYEGPPPPKRRHDDDDEPHPKRDISYDDHSSHGFLGGSSHGLHAISSHGFHEASSLGFHDSEHLFGGSSGSGYSSPSSSHSGSGYSSPSSSHDVHFSSSPVHQAPSYHQQEPNYYKPAKYNFKYVVQDQYGGNDFGHHEARDGDDTKGAYYVQLPDGRRQTVNYYVNKGSGYVAQVHYDGEAQFPPPSRYGGGHHGGGGGGGGGGHHGGGYGSGGGGVSSVHHGSIGLGGGLSSGGGGGGGYHGGVDSHHGSIGLGGGLSSGGGGGGYHGGVDNHIESADIHLPQGHELHSSSPYGGGSESLFSSLHGGGGGGGGGGSESLFSSLHGGGGGGGGGGSPYH